MTDVLYFGSDSTMPLCEGYVKSNSYIQKVLFVDRRKYDEKTKDLEDNTNPQIVTNLIKTDKETILAKDRFYSVSCGPKYAILVNTEGCLWGFGHGSRKHLFQGSISTGNVATKFTTGYEQRYVAVACGDNHFIATTTGQMPYAWGDISQGRVVVNDDESSITNTKNINIEHFTKVFETDSNSHFKKVYYTPEASQVPKDSRFIRLETLACGPENSFFVINSRVFAAGRGNLGVGATNIISNEYLQETGHTPFILYNLFRYKIKGVSAGKSHALAWDVEGFLYSWGDPEYGKLGHPVDSETLFEKEILPKKIKSLEGERIVQAACGYRHSIALSNTGHIYMWGNCESADKGGTRENTLSFANIRPKKLEVKSSNAGEGSVLFVKVAAGAYHNAAIDKEGHIYTWGDSSSGCLGHEKTNDRAIPTELTALRGKKAIDVACGEKFTVLIVSGKDVKIVSKCVEEFNYNSIKTFQERLKAINDFNYKKKKFRIERKKKELSYAPPDEIKIPITQISQKKITDQLTKYYVQKSLETNPKNRDKPDFKIPFFGMNHGQDELMDLSGNASDKYKDTSTSINKPPSLTKLEQVPEGHEEENQISKRKPKRGLTISPQFKFSGKNLHEHMEQAPKSTHDAKKHFFGTPTSKQSTSKHSIHKHSETKRTLATVPNSPNINYVFDAVTEHLNEKNDFYHEFNAVMKISKPNDDMSQPNTHRPATEPRQVQTIKQAESELQRKSHVRTSEFESLSNSKVIARTSRPQTAKSSQGYKLDFASPKMSTFTAGQFSSQMIRPLSSNAAQGRLLKAKPKRSEDCDSYDFIKALQIQKHNEKAEQRYQMLAERKTQHIYDLAAERDYKIKLVQEKKNMIQLEKKHKIADMTYKRSTEFKNLAEHIKERKAHIEHMQKQLIGFIGCQHLLYTIKMFIKHSRDKLYFQRIQNAKATKIQKNWKKYKIIQRIQNLTEKQKNIMRMMILRFIARRRRVLEAKRIRKVYLMFHYYNLSKRIAQKLVALRNIIIPIQKFALWSRRVFRLRFRKLALAWDMNIMKMSNIKFEDNKLVSATTGKMSAIEYGSPAKTNSRVESNMNKQKKVIESETNSLGLGKKETNKKAGDIKTRFEVIMDHMKLRGAMLLIEGEDAQKQQQQQQPSQGGAHMQRKSIAAEAKSAANTKGDLVVTFDLIIRDTILPYNVHDAETAFAPQYTIKKESQSIHEKILPKLIQLEVLLKTKILREIYDDRVMSYAKSIKDYEWHLKDFMIKNRKDIDLERTKMMLSTPKETLRAISRKEETEFRMENANANKRRPLNQLGLGEKDHLPFAKLKIKIAAAMPDAPKFPTYKTTLSFDEFKVYFRRFFEEYKNEYAQIIQAARLKGRTAYKG